MFERIVAERWGKGITFPSCLCVSVFQSSIVVEVPPYNKKTTDPVQVQFYVSNGRKRRSLTQNFTYLPAVRRHLPAEVKQERWEADHNPPGFSPASCQVPSHDQVLGPDVVYYDSCDVPVHRGPPSQNVPRLHHPPPSSVPLQTPSMFLPTSSIPLHTSASQTSSVPHQILIPLQASSVPHQTFTIPPQTSSLPPQTASVSPQISPQISAMPPQASSAPLQTFTVPLSTSSGGPQREHFPSQSSSRAFVTPADPQKDTLLSSPGEAQSIKQEPEDRPNLGSLGLQEITLDDVNEIIDRDICSLSSGAQPDQFEQYQRYDWEHKSGDAASPFSGDPQ
ncbi:nuclear factor of activated T-cells, cytoplasmic 3-like [Micropterus salmoides]|uniref:nuclear factor of activated T-cells, cytoplasmic 3-like n=1 Tax=Micropterus salmoides TaxID=27706 RepID=UPI0018EC8B30|nr:nuclear factor of activated T-cells, cytoplasmic 3-like [Micropterus salmoides]